MPNVSEQSTSIRKEVGGWPELPAVVVKGGQRADRVPEFVFGGWTAPVAVGTEVVVAESGGWKADGLSC